jgi:hypothetical protein
MPEDQFNRHSRDYYVAAKLAGNDVLIYGILSSDEVSELPIKDFGKGVATKYKELMAI